MQRIEGLLTFQCSFLINTAVRVHCDDRAPLTLICPVESRLDIIMVRAAYAEPIEMPWSYESGLVVITPE